MRIEANVGSMSSRIEIRTLDERCRGKDQIRPNGLYLMVLTYPSRDYEVSTMGWKGSEVSGFLEVCYRAERGSFSSQADRAATLADRLKYRFLSPVATWWQRAQKRKSYIKG